MGLWQGIDCPQAPRHKAYLSGRPLDRWPPVKQYRSTVFSMQTFLAKCSALGVILGGFIFTGDVAWLRQRGSDLMNATAIPNGFPAVPTGAPAVPTGLQAVLADPSTTAKVVSPRSRPAPRPATAESPAAPATLQEHACDAPIGQPANHLSAPVNGLDAVDLKMLRPGDRVLVWIGQSASSGAAGSTATSLIAFDIVDSVTGEAIEHRHAPSAPSPDRARHGGMHAAPRRVRIVGSSGASLLGSSLTATIAPGRIARGETIQLSPLAFVHGGQGLGAREAIGPVQAIAIQALSR